MVITKRPCLEESRPIGVGASGTTAGAAGGGEGRIVVDDVLFYVGKRRQAYHVSAENLIRGSAYFKNLLQSSSGNSRSSSSTKSSRVVTPLPPIVIDCEESVFESMLLLIRYGTWEALPAMSESEVFRLKREAEIYGVQYHEPPPPLPSKSPAPLPLARTYSSDQSVASTMSPGSSPGGSPKSDPDMVRPPLSSRRFSGRLVGTTSRNLAELPNFPTDLSDPAKLLLVACLDEEKAPTYACSHCRAGSSGGGARGAPTQWALSFHFRYAFCTSCGRTPASMPPKHFADMFTAAAAHYQSAPLEQSPFKPQAAWWIGSDSTCMLRFVSSDCSGPDACSSTRCAGLETVWAVTFSYSHAFCTRCWQPAHGPALLGLLLAIRYGGASNKKSGRSSFKIPGTPVEALIS